MTRFTKDSKYRLRDFRRRGSWASENCKIYTHAQLSQYYIPIHPFGNEKEVVKSLNLAKESCGWVDAYWNMESDVSFIQVLTKEMSNDGKVGLYAQWGNKMKEYLTLTAIIEQPYVTRDIFEEKMAQFVKLGMKPTEQLRLKLRNSKLTL